MSACVRACVQIADTYPTSHFSPFKCCCVAWKKGITPKILMLCFAIINIVSFETFMCWAVCQVIGPYDTWATHAGLVHNVTDTDRWTQNGNTHGLAMATREREELEF